MLSCDACSDLLLDFLYGLLEGEELEAVRAHLLDCNACTAALAEAEAQQGLLARAALVCPRVPEFAAPGTTQRATAPPEAVVEAPTPQLPLPAGAPASVPLPRRRPLARPLALGAAAALLLAAGAGFYLYQNGLEQRRAEATRTRRAVETTDARLAKWERDSRAELEQLPRTVAAAYLNVQVTGPASYQPGAPARYEVQTRTLDGKPAPARLVTRLVDPTREHPVLFEAKLDSEGAAAVQLPPDLAVRSGSLPRLEVEATTPQGRTRVEELLYVTEPAYLTHLALNKSLYRGGDVLFFRSLTLERFSLRPPAAELELTFTLADRTGRPVRQLRGTTRHGVAGGELALGPDLPPGDYTLTVSAAGAEQILPESRSLLVVREEVPQVVFDRPGYRPGETVVAGFRGRLKPNGEAIPNQAVTVAATVGGQPLRLPGAAPGAPLQLRTDAQGVAAFHFALPQTLSTGDATLRIQVHDGLNDEEVLAKVPLAPAAPALTVEFFPEGGDLITALPGRVYFHARDAAGRPVALDAPVTDRQGRAVTRARTAGEGPPSLGAGVFSLTPEPGQEYTLRTTGPAGEALTFSLPPARRGGVTLTVASPVGAEGETVAMTVRDTEPGRRLLVLANCRGRVVDQQFVTAGRDGAEVILRPLDGTRGVVRLTVYEAGDRLVPLAERLVYRTPAARLVLAPADAAEKAIETAERARLDFTVKDEAGRPAKAVLLAAGVREPWRQAGQKKEQAPGPRLHLTRELRGGEDIEDADVLVADHPAGREALDLFLGTLGWRRPLPPDQAVPTVAENAKQSAREAARSGGPAVLVARNDPARIRDAYTRTLAARQEQAQLDAEQRRRTLHEEREQLAEQARVAAVALAEHERLVSEWLRRGVGAAVLALVVVGALLVIVGAVQAARRAPSARWCFGLAAGSLGLCLLAYAATAGLRNADAPGAVNLAGLQPREFDPRPAPAVPPLDEALRNAAKGRTMPGGELLAELPRRRSGTEKRDEKKPVAGWDRTPQADTIKALMEAEPHAQLGRLNARAGDRGARDAVAALHQLAQARRDAEMERRYAELEKLQRPTKETETGGFGGGTPSPSQPGIGGPTQPGGGKGGGAKGKKADPSQPATPLPTPVAPPGAKGPDPNSRPELTAVPREYAFRRQEGAASYQDTLFWYPLLETADGRVSVAFDLPGKPGPFRVLLYGHDATGRLGSYEGILGGGAKAR